MAHPEQFKLAFIREAECIGCTKCIQACPFDAIIGAENQMHTVLLNDCTGCELCVAPCPVDCIEMHDVSTQLYDKDKVKQHVLARKQRLQKEAAQEKQILAGEITTRQSYIQAALARAKAKRLT